VIVSPLVPFPIAEISGAPAPIIYSTLADLASITSPVIGIPGRVDNTVTFQKIPAVTGFDCAYTGDARQNRIVFTDGVTDLLPNLDVYTIELDIWLNGYSITNGVVSDGDIHLIWGLHNSNTVKTNWDSIALTTSSYWATVADGGTFTFNPALTSPTGFTIPADTWTKVRFVVDKNGIGGTKPTLAENVLEGNGDVMRIYLNGVNVYSYTSARAVSTQAIKAAVLGSYDSITNLITAGSKAYFKEYKLYNVANTIF